MRWQIGLCGVACLGIFSLATVQLGEGAIRIAPGFRWKPNVEAADGLAAETGGTWTAVETSATDGVTLRASLFRPAKPNGGLVILLHGVASSRDGMLGHARFLLKAGYTCLLPDSRGHGVSGGDLVTYGIRESDDVAQWAQWLQRNAVTERLYGLGESMGAAVLLESLPKVPQFRAVVAECSFSDFRAVAGDRLAQFTGIPAPWLFRPAVESGFLYVRARYGIRLDQASPAEALRATGTPVLLIHGLNDHNIPAVHSERLQQVRPQTTELWEVPGAGHVGGLSTAPERFPEAVVRWFH